MKAEQVAASIFARTTNGDAQLIHGLEKDQWLNTLTAGQILKGRVLREYSSSQYGVSFNGQERVVDSAIPLSKGDVLAGRVLTVNENTVSIKLIDRSGMAAASSEPKAAAMLSGTQTPLEMEMAQLRIDLTQLQKSQIMAAASQVGNTTVAIKVGLYLAKMSIPLSAELVRVLADRVLDKQAQFLEVDKSVPALSFDQGGGDIEQQAILKTLQTYFSQEARLDSHLEESLGAGKGDSKEIQDLVQGLSGFHADLSEDESSDDDQLNAMLARLLNSNNDSHIQHKLATLPVIIDGQLREFDVAFFDQPERLVERDALNNKRLTFSLDTDLGLVNLNVNIVNDRVRVDISAESEGFLDGMEEYSSSLDGSLVEAGWLVDGLNYQLKKNSHDGSAIYNIIEHVLQQGSLDIEL